MLEFTEYIRIPFKVEAIEVTEENMEEIAKYVGDYKKKEDGTPYILVDRRIVPGVQRVYAGYWMTRMGDNIRCYAKKIFEEQFMEASQFSTAPATTANV